MKAGLVMTDAADVGFKVANFKRDNVAKLEKNWERIKLALRLGVRLLAGIGFSERTLSAKNVLIPVADYLYQRNADDAYLTQAAHKDDRAAIRSWVIRSLMKRGVWGGSSDTLLSRLRTALRANPPDVFPVDAIEQAMVVIGKSLRFEPEEVEDLAETSYGSRAFAILSLLYAGSNVQQTTYHVDHIFPRSRFTKPRLLKAGVSDAEVDEFMEWSNLLPNLQLLPDAANTQKQAVLALEWWSSAEPDEQARDALFAAHHMHDLPPPISLTSRASTSPGGTEWFSVYATFWGFRQRQSRCSRQRQNEAQPAPVHDRPATCDYWETRVATRGNSLRLLVDGR